MNTLHFKYAIEVERTRSITQAAENLFMAQPNLSKAIKELEDNLGFPIFERTSKGVVPTTKGTEFLIYARNVLVELDKMESLSSSNDEEIQIINISIPRGSYIASGVTKLISELDFDKGIHVNVQETNSMQSINNIIEGSYNLGIIRYQTIYENYFLDYLRDKQLCYDTIWEFDCLVLMSNRHPLAETEEVKAKELGKYIEIVHGDTVVPYLSTNESKKEDKKDHTTKKIYVYERCSQFDLLTTIPYTYMWISPIPESLLGRYQLVQRKCSGVTRRFKDLLICPKGYKFSALDKKLIDKLYEAKNDVAFKEYL